MLPIGSARPNLSDMWHPVCIEGRGKHRLLPVELLQFEELLNGFNKKSGQTVKNGLNEQILENSS